MQTDVESKNFVGLKIQTPDGLGEVTGGDDRYVFVKLENGAFAQFGHRDVSLVEKKAEPAPGIGAPSIPSGDPVAPPAAPEEPAQ